MFDKTARSIEKPEAEETRQGGFDYTKWQRDLFKDISIEELTEKAIAYEKSHPHDDDGKRLSFLRKFPANGLKYSLE